ncbi:MAG: metal ABC transporter substrate-binding protein [Clostridiales bacterium]|nr:metal ABC transporter substrate-binding protein [Clostridiales bacterium]
MKKRIVLLLLTLLLALAMLSGCNVEKWDDGKISVVCTIFPQYDWVREILGDQAENMNLTILLNNRIDLHSYQPSVKDMTKISKCDVFIYVGGESDKWVANALKQATNPDMIVINLLEVLGEAAKIEERKEGMEEEDDEDDEDDEDGPDYDEHVWLSLKNAQIFCEAIAKALSEVDAENAAEYANNLAAYKAKLAALDAQYNTAVNAAPVKVLLFGDRFPFRYLVDDYGIDYHAAFMGCSTETKATFDTIIFLAKKVDELSLKTVMVTESTDKKLAKQIIRNTASKKQQILELDAMQSVTAKDIKRGATYLSIMESNLDVLKEALK